MAKNINKTVFDDATKLKLDIFGECFEQWLPVFNNNNFIESVYIFDFFAGSGKDIADNFGSPIILLDKARGKDCQYCKNAKKKIKFIFNDSHKDKSNELKQNIEKYLAECKDKNNCTNCVYEYEVLNYNFQDIFTNPEITRILENKNLGKFILLDQYGFSQIDESIFKKLISYPKTDFIFFISTAYISRFREHPNIKKYINTSKIDFDNIRPNEIHRAVADYFRDLIPKGKEYYLHHFSIQKERKGNYYGLIFGTNHTLGMEKFLKVCWKEDPFSGEANYNIDNNYEKGSLFEQLGENVKKDEVKETIKQKILSKEITDNITGLIFAIKNGCEPIVFTEVVLQLEKNNIIQRLGDVNNQSSIIHKVKKYTLKLLNNGTQN